MGRREAAVAGRGAKILKNLSTTKVFLTILSLLDGGNPMHAPVRSPTPVRFADSAMTDSDEKATIRTKTRIRNPSGFRGLACRSLLIPTFGVALMLDVTETGENG